MLCTDDARRRTPDTGRRMMDAGPSTPYYRLTGELKIDHFQLSMSLFHAVNVISLYDCEDHTDLLIMKKGETNAILAPKVSFEQAVFASRINVHIPSIC